MRFVNGYFVKKHLPELLARHERDRWEKLGSEFRTRDLRAAMRFSQDADSSAEVILRRYTVRYYPLPPHPCSARFPLDPHQKEGVRWILSRSRAYLAHAPGAGKTIQAVVAVNKVGGDALLICPPLLVENWKREIQKWGTPGTRVQFVREWDSRREFYPQGLTWIICPDSILTTELPALLKGRFSFVIVDEASRFKEVTAQRTQALFGYGLLTKARHVVLLDGSPVLNRPMELWVPTYSLSPGSIDFMDRTEFGFRYCGPKMNERGLWEFKWSSNVPELQQRLTKNFMHVVKEVLLSHPERKRRILFMTNDVRSQRMKTWQKENLSKIKPESVPTSALAEYMHELGIRKVRWAGQYLKLRVLAGEKVLAFFWHRAVGHQLYNILRPLFPVVYIDGSIPMDSREKAIQDYQRGVPLLLGNIVAMGRGVNLQNTDRVVFVEYSWSDETNKQAEKRASRRGSTRLQVPCDYLCAPGSVDEIKLSTLFRKQKLVERLITNEANNG